MNYEHFKQLEELTNKFGYTTDYISSNYEANKKHLHYCSNEYLKRNDNKCTEERILAVTIVPSDNEFNVIKVKSWFSKIPSCIKGDIVLYWGVIKGLKDLEIILNLIEQTLDNVELDRIQKDSYRYDWGIKRIEKSKSENK